MRFVLIITILMFSVAASANSFNGLYKKIEGNESCYNAPEIIITSYSLKIVTDSETLPMAKLSRKRGVRMCSDENIICAVTAKVYADKSKIVYRSKARYRDSNTWNSRFIEITPIGDNKISMNIVKKAYGKDKTNIKEQKQICKFVKEKD